MTVLLEIALELFPTQRRSTYRLLGGHSRTLAHGTSISLGSWHAR